MAIYHLHVQKIGRGEGRSATAAAAYRTGRTIPDSRTGLTFDYSRRQRAVIASGLVGWDGDTTSLWNAAEAAERRRDAVTAREIVIALPHEIARGDAQQLVERFAGFLRERHGLAVEWAIHAPGRQGDARNLHGHVMLTTRRSDGRALGEKAREIDATATGPGHITAWREEWASLINGALARTGSDATVDHRSHRARGTGLEPAIHLGPSATAMERRGIRTWKGDQLRKIAARRDLVTRILDRLDKEVRPAVLTPQEREARVRALTREIGGAELVDAEAAYLAALHELALAGEKSARLAWWRLLARRQARRAEREAQQRVEVTRATVRRITTAAERRARERVDAETRRPARVTPGRGAVRVRGPPQLVR